MRDRATEMLGEIGEGEDLFRLLFLSKDADWPIRCTAASSLSALDDNRVRPRLLQMARRDRQPTVRKWAIQALIDHAPEDKMLLETLRELLVRELHPFPLLVIYGGLARLGERDYLEALRNLADHPGVRTRGHKQVLTEGVAAMLVELGGQADGD